MPGRSRPMRVWCGSCAGRATRSGRRRARTMTAEAVAVAVAEVGRDAEDRESEWSANLVAERFASAWGGAKISGQRLRVLLGTETPDLFSLLLRGAIGMMRAKE